MLVSQQWQVCVGWLSIYIWSEWHLSERKMGTEGCVVLCAHYCQAVALCLHVCKHTWPYLQLAHVSMSGILKKWFKKDSYSRTLCMLLLTSHKKTGRTYASTEFPQWRCSILSSPENKLPIFFSFLEGEGMGQAFPKHNCEGNWNHPVLALLLLPVVPGAANIWLLELFLQGNFGVSSLSSLLV